MGSMTETALIPATGAAVAHSYARAEANVQKYLDSARARNTIRGYRSHFRQFQAWCAAANVCPLPAAPETIAVYLGERAGHLRPTTLACHLGRNLEGAQDRGPAVAGEGQRADLRGDERAEADARHDRRPEGAPVLTDDLRLMLRGMPAGLLGLRDRALLLVGFAGLSPERAGVARCGGPDVLGGRPAPAANRASLGRDGSQVRAVLHVPVGFGPRQFRGDIGVKQEAGHSLTGRPVSGSLSKFRSRPLKGDSANNWARLFLPGGRPASSLARSCA